MLHVLGIALLGASLASASELSSESIWKTSKGNGFKEDTVQWGVSAGGAKGVNLLGSQVEHDFILGNVNAGWIFTDVVCPDHWWGGNWELRGELFGGGQIDPSRYVIGLTPALRYHFATGTPFVPFFQAGAGVSATDVRGPDLSTDFEFNLMIGGGVNYFITDNVALGLEYRLFHLSNAGIESPNTGVNSHAILAGVSWWF